MEPGTPRGSVLISGSGYHQQMAHISQSVKTLLKIRSNTLCQRPESQTVTVPLLLYWTQQGAISHQHPYAPCRVNSRLMSDKRATPLSPCSHQHHLHIPTESCVKSDKHTLNQTGSWFITKQRQGIWGLTHFGIGLIYYTSIISQSQLTCQKPKCHKMDKSHKSTHSMDPVNVSYFNFSHELNS